jgi:hypothetical protein
MADTTREALAAEAKRLAEEYADQHKANGALRWKTLHALFATIDRLATPEQAPAVQAGALAERWAGYARLLKEARRYLGDKRLYHDELDGRKRRETNQEHVDRISTVIQENEDLQTLVDEIDAALATTPAVQAEQPAEPHRYSVVYQGDRAMVPVEVLGVYADSHSTVVTIAAPRGQAEDAQRLDFVAMHGLLSLDSVSGKPGGNGQRLVAATRAAIDAARASDARKGEAS